MATYAIGDLQGCYGEFQKLVEVIGFNPAKDKLWLVGDIVNRGPDSLGLLRTIKDMGDAVVTVLGNHDLHLLLVAEGLAKQRSGDTLQTILEAPDCPELLNWLRHQKLLHVDGDYALVHAGLLPSWEISQASELAQEVEEALCGGDFHEFLAHMYGNEPNYWNEGFTGYDRLRVIINAMTRLRVCTPDGRMDFAYKGKLQSIPKGLVPWFEPPYRASQATTIIFGHWSALGLHVSKNLIALDTGCIWGGMLTAMRLEDRKVFQVSCEQQAAAMRQK